FWRLVLRPLKAVERYAAAVRSGGGERGSGERRFRGEIESLRESIETMVALLVKRYGELQRAEEQVRGLNEDLERRVAERTAELTSANRELEAFSSSVSHDLSAPLRIIAGFIEMLQESASPLDEKSTHYLSVALGE